VSSVKQNNEKINPAFHPYEIIRKVLLPYWPIYAVALVLGYFVADFKVKQQLTVYQVNASLIVKDNSEGNAVLSVLSTSGPNNAVDNEIQILKSTHVFAEAVKRLDAYTRVVLEGDLTKAEMSYNLPVRFRVDDLDSFKGYINTYFQIKPNRDSIEVAGKLYTLNSQRIQIGEYEVQLIADKARLGALNTENKYSLEILNLENAVNRFRSSFLAVGAGEKSSVINVSMTGGNVENTQTVLNEILDIHTSYSIVEKRKSAQYSLNFIDERLRLINGDLDSLERKIEEFKISNGGIDVNQQEGQFIGKVNQADQQIAEIDLQLSLLMDVENYIRDKWHSENIIPSTMGLTEPMLTRLLNSLYNLETQLDKKI
jgi:tyrosine-protein kinase Etk/Wzc